MAYLKHKHIHVKPPRKESNFVSSGSLFKRTEFVLCIVGYLILLVLPPFHLLDENANGIFAQIQAFIAIYLVIRFSSIGFFTVASLNLLEIIELMLVYLQIHNFVLLIGLSTKIFSLISAGIVYLLVRRQEAQKEELHRLSITDELTAVYNRRHFHSALEKEIAKVQKNGGSVGLMLVDIDNFKMFNDIYGHDYGDRILKGTAALLNDVFKQGGMVSRYGGDEFAIILPGADIHAIEFMANDLRERQQALKGEYYHDFLDNNITLSIGLSEFPNISGCRDELISQADMALYHAKNLGKDGVHFYRDVLLQLRNSIHSNDQQLLGTFKALLSSISMKDKYTLGHSERVSSYAMMIGEKLGLKPREISILQHAGLLHDIGKIEIPKSILNKAGTLTEGELRLIREHPVYSANILEPLEGMDQLIDYVKHHHERFDGKGYPDGIAGKKISLGARILCVADSFDAMLSDRPYNKRMSVEEAFLELERCAGTQFDPEIVGIFLEVMKENLSEDYETVI